MLRSSAIGVRSHLPFASPVLRGRQLYTFTFRPGARLARQTVGGSLRVIAGTCHPKRVNRASGSDYEEYRTKRQELPPIALFVSQPGRCESRLRFRSNHQPITEGAVSELLPPTGMLTPSQTSQTWPMTTRGRGVLSAMLMLRQRVDYDNIEDLVHSECTLASLLADMRAAITHALSLQRPVQTDGIGSSARRAAKNYHRRSMDA